MGGIFTMEVIFHFGHNSSIDIDDKANKEI